MQKLIIFCGPIEDPSPVASARRIFKSEHLEGLLSYKATIDLITSSKYSFLQYDTDPYLLSLIQVILHIMYLFASLILIEVGLMLVVNLHYLLWFYI